MKTYWGSGGIAPRILDVGIRWRWSASRPSRFTPRERAPVVPMDKRLGGPQRGTGRGGEEKNSQPPARTRTPLIIQSVAQHYTTELSRLLWGFCIIH
jgi:hypothetical protein